MIMSATLVAQKREDEGAYSAPKPAAADKFSVIVRTQSGFHINLPHHQPPTPISGTTL